ncbi:MAG: sigma-70 family RNA polymerase sigma factor [Marinifilaceae bacterium]
MRKEEFENLFIEQYQPMVQLALFYVTDMSVAEDIVQEIFVSLWEHKDGNKPIVNVNAYLRYSIRNNAIAYIRKQKNLYLNEIVIADNILSDDNNLEHYLERIEVAIEKLPLKRREILKQHILYSHSYQDLSQQYEISVNTVKDHIKKAYAFIRNEINENTHHSILYVVFILESI